MKRMFGAREETPSEAEIWSVRVKETFSATVCVLCSAFPKLLH